MKEIYVKRDLEEKIKKYLKRKEIISIVGTRQCGKTTLMKHIFRGLKNAKFISFDDRDILNIFVNDTKLFVKKYVDGNDYLFIDEFQYAKNGGRILKFIYDNSKTKIIISGSSIAELSIQSIKYLVGRIFVFRLAPFSFKEYIRYRDKNLYELLGKKISEPASKEIRKLYEEYVIYGGYPDVVLSKTNEEKIEVLRNIYNTYLLREIKEILQISDDFKISKLIKAISLQIGSIANYNELSTLTGFEHYELMKYINILKKTFIILESRPFFTNKRKELVKAPRFYLLDNGFRNISIKNFSETELRTDRGILNENFIASELFKNEYELQYWRTKAGAEVDFIVENKGNLIPIEVKSIIKKPKLTRSFKNFISEYKVKKGFVLSENMHKRNDTILFSYIYNISEFI